MRKELRLSGSGGQGVITAAIIFAEAAVREGRQVAQSQSYGPEARGGASKAEVIVDDASIYHPHVEHPDIVLAMTQAAADKYAQDLKAGGVLVVDSELVPNVPAVPQAVTVKKIPITKLAIQETGRPLSANIVALGVLVRLSEIVRIETAEQAMIARMPPASVEANKKALHAGFVAAEK